MYLSDMVAEYMEREGSDALDFHLHLRQIQGEELIERSRVDIPARGEISVLIRGTETRTRVDLTAAGWDWVREQRTAETSGAAAMSPPPSANSGD